MQNAVYGIYRDGNVIFDEPIPNMKKEARVVVVFLENEPEKQGLMDMFSVLGEWEDSRSVDEIIDETHNSRISSMDVQL